MSDEHSCPNCGHALDYPSSNNELKVYNTADIRAWLEEIMSDDGMGEYATLQEKDAAESMLGFLAPDDAPGSDSVTTPEKKS